MFNRVTAIIDEWIELNKPTHLKVNPCEYCGEVCEHNYFRSVIYVSFVRQDYVTEGEIQEFKRRLFDFAMQFYFHPKDQEWIKFEYGESDAYYGN